MMDDLTMRVLELANQHHEKLEEDRNRLIEAAQKMQRVSEKVQGVSDQVRPLLAAIADAFVAGDQRLKLVQRPSSTFDGFDIYLANGNQQTNFTLTAFGSTDDSVIITSTIGGQRSSSIYNGPIHQQKIKESIEKALFSWFKHNITIPEH